jgi:hypothetical protein
MTAPERLSRTIRLTLFGVNVQAVVARFASVSRIHQHKFYTKLNAFVGQKLPQLVKAPRVTPAPLYLGSRQFVSSFPDASEVFECNNLFVGFSRLHELVADFVVMMRLKASLSTRQPFLKLPTSTPTASRAFRGFLLKFGSQMTVMVTNLCDVFTAIFVSTRCNNNICPT